MAPRQRLAPWLGLALFACAAAPPSPGSAPSGSSGAPPSAEPELEPAPAHAADEGEPIADEYPVPSAEPPTPDVPAPSVVVPSDAGVAAARAKAESGKLAEAAAELSRVMARVDREAPLEDRVLAHALVGRRHAEKKDVKKARVEYQQVLAAWSDPEKAVKTIMGAAPDEAQALRRLGQALTAVGEALFFEAEQKRATALALRPPPFSGTASDEGIRDHLAQRVRPWMQKRRVLEGEASAAFRKILELQPAPPPRWVVAAASEVASMQEALPKDLEKLAIPPSLRRDPALRSAYQDALRDAMKPELERAKAAYRSCKSLAVKFRHQDAHSKACEDRLTALERQSP